MKYMKTLLCGALAGLCITALPSHAHGIWFAQRSADLALIYGEGGDDLDTVKRLPLIRRVDAYDANGSAVPTALTPVGKLAVVDLAASPAVVATVLDNGIWTKTADGKWHKKPKNDVANAAHSSQNFKYAVHVRSPLKTVFQALPGHDLQLMPLGTLPTQRGEKLALRVLFKGQPYAGAKIITDFVNDPDAEPLISDANGLVVVSVRNQGLNVIAAEIEVPPPDARLTDATEHVATLSFRLAHAPE
ncbi:DUF4198 domain-containing protein [Propionivibrio limicola]|uniref:DUF4198 domain-containing protein n=1 Tax=Propionivibrio limicola TaxID=167645 RepID=UPI00129180D7|nr:DUF4198 domain-containing protein [Propionivibrio limicola]